MKVLAILLALGSSCAAVPNISDIFYEKDYADPVHVHLAFGDLPNCIVVTWSTFNVTNDTRVRYGVTGQSVLSNEVLGNETLFTDGGRERRSQWIHKVTLCNLAFNTSYRYVAGSVYGWSDEFTFRTPPPGEDWVLNAIVYGDMGIENAHSLSFLQTEVQENPPLLFLHVGDFAYDMNTNNARVGDQFMAQIQSIAGKIPYMTCPGNHEQAYNFSNYRYRFNMPGPISSIVYSINVGRVHFIFFSTETYYFQNYGFDLIKNQYNWLVNDLKEANSKENRTKRPWIVMSGHRPMYCTNTDLDCNLNATRIGINGQYALEPLLVQYGVDLLFWGHEHSYECTWPVYNSTVYNGSLSEPYTNPRAPVHVTTGSAGCDEQHDPFKKSTQPWSAFRNSDYGYLRMTVYNTTTLCFEQVSVDKLQNNRGTVIHKRCIVNNNHGPFNITQTPQATG